jgi:hypothetical protein
VSREPRYTANEDEWDWDAWMTEPVPPPVPEPCQECPWRRVATPGYLGPNDADEWVEIALKRPRRPQVAAGIEQDTKAVFASDAEFRAYHTRPRKA